jgi:hypothetical protein
MSAYLLSATRPTISMSRSSLPPIAMRLPIGSAPRPKYSAKRRLTTATFGASAPSASAMSRPASSGMPMAAKKSAPTML